MRKERFTEWVIIFLIVLFFAIPVCSLAVTDSVAGWPRLPNTFIFNVVLK